MITLKGVKPIGKKQWKRGNFYIYGVVEPATGEQYYQEFPRLNYNCFQEFLKGFGLHGVTTPSKAPPVADLPDLS